MDIGHAQKNVAYVIFYSPSTRDAFQEQFAYPFLGNSEGRRRLAIVDIDGVFTWI